MKRVILAMFLIGCGAGKSIVIKPADIDLQAATVEVDETSSTVQVPEDAKQYFKQELERRLYEDAKFRKGGDLKVAYRFIQYDSGNQFTRWFLGGIGNAGEGTITVEARYLDGSGTDLAAIQAEGKIGSGFFGGSFKNALEKAAEQVANYARQHFREAAPGVAGRSSDAAAGSPTASVTPANE